MLDVTALSPSPPPRTQRRYTLADLLRRAEGDRAVALAALRWLEQQRGVYRCCIAFVSDDRHRLEVLSVHGGRRIARHISIGLEEITHPLVAALGWREPAIFAVHETERAGLPWRGRSSYVSPLAAGEETFGLLIVAARRSEQNKIHRVSRLIAERLVLLRYARQRATARRLERENVRLQSILDILSDPILLTDAEGHMLAANGAAERLLAADEGASEGRRRAVALNNMLFSSAAFTTVGTTDAGKREILLVDPSAGDDLLYELLSSPLGPGSTAEVAHILRDINDLHLAAQQIEEKSRRQRDAEAEAAAERDRLDSILNAVAAPILVTDASGNIECMNEPAARLFTVDRGTCTEIMLRRVRANDAVWSTFVASTRIGLADPTRAPLNLVAPATGEPLPVEAVARRVPSKQGDVDAVVVILNDRREALEKARLYERVRRHSDELDAKVREATAELVAQNELLRRQALALEEASAAKTRFLANMSHELRTPLHAVIGYADLLLRRGVGELAEAHRRKLERLLANAKHLLALISDLLDLSRIEAGKMPLHLTDVQVEAVLREAMADLEPLLTRACLRLEVALDPLPILRTDAQKLKQIVLNLLSNAIKFTPAGFVRVAAREAASLAEVQIEVTDSGIGIAPADLERIFEDFNRADSSYTRPYGGTGLGLSICRRLAAMLDGRVSVVSRPGEGSTFTLHLPHARGAR